MTAIAGASGYASLRRFHAAFQETFGRAPGSLRRGTAPADGACRLRLSYRPPWDWQQFRSYFALRAVPGVEQVLADRYIRTYRFGAMAGWLAVRALPDEPALELTLSPAATAALPAIVARVRRMFDLDADAVSIASHLAADPVLAPLVSRWPGLRLPSAFDSFEQAVRTIVGQQIAVKAAVTVVGRLVARLGEAFVGGPEGGPDRLFPTPEALAEAELRGLGLPGRRVDTLKRFAGAVASGELKLSAEQGPEELVARLLALPGIGPWTAEYIALRAFGEPDAFPAGDLGLRRAKAWGSDPLRAGELSERAERWRPWRAYGAMYLWQIQ
jgi:DNA-3-methyladenine glycosylase II